VVNPNEYTNHLKKRAYTQIAGKCHVILIKDTISSEGLHKSVVDRNHETLLKNLAARTQQLGR
jgi:hypothetical protein